MDADTEHIDLTLSDMDAALVSSVSPGDGTPNSKQPKPRFIMARELKVLHDTAQSMRRQGAPGSVYGQPSGLHNSINTPTLDDVTSSVKDPSSQTDRFRKPPFSAEVSPDMEAATMSQSFWGSPAKRRPKSSKLSGRRSFAALDYLTPIDDNIRASHDWSRSGPRVPTTPPSSTTNDSPRFFSPNRTPTSSSSPLENTPSRANPFKHADHPPVYSSDDELEWYNTSSGSVKRKRAGGHHIDSNHDLASSAGIRTKRKSTKAAKPTHPDLSADTKEPTTKLNEISAMILCINEQVVQTIRNLAIKVNTLVDRMDVLERMVYEQKGHMDETCKTFEVQVNTSIRGLKKKFQETIDAIDDHEASQIVVPGGPYGGPRDLPKKPGKSWLSSVVQG